MGIYPSATTVVGYTYRAELFCPKCVVEAMIADGDASPAARDMPVERVLDQCAGAGAIDRTDEGTFDSWEFPKVLFASMTGPDDRCADCQEGL